MPIDLIELSGAPREMGRQHGEMFRTEIREFIDIRMDRILKAVKEKGLGLDRQGVLDLAREHLPFHEAYAPDVHKEFLGIAEGADVPPEELMIGNGLTDVRDVVLQSPGEQECTSFIANRNGTDDGTVWFGQNWDMHATAEPYIRAFLRKPKDAPRTLTMTTTGCLTLTGINEEGIGIGNNNLVPKDARPGVIYLAMMHNALAQRTFDDTVRAITDARRASGHNYLLVSSEGNICFIETTATDSEILDADAPVAVHANHYRAPRLVADDVSMDAPGESSLNRERRLGELLGDKIDMGRVIGGLSDREPRPEICICQIGGDGITCGVVIGKVDAGELWATRGNALENDLTCMRF